MSNRTRVILIALVVAAMAILGWAKEAHSDTSQKGGVAVYSCQWTP